jgi:putative transposase
LKVAEVRWQLQMRREAGDDEGAEQLKEEKFLYRMWDLSQFMKVLKQRFTQWFNKRHGRKGTLWEDRFKSVLVEDGWTARVMAAYIDLNPVRAGMVEDPRRYRWSGYGEAVAGRKVAREGLQRMMFEYEQMRGSEAVAAREVADWRRVAAGYRQILYMDGGEGPETEGSGGGGETGTRRRKGFTRKEVEAVLAKGGKLSEGEILGGRVRYFIDGVMVGTKEFVENSYRLSRERFGPKRTTGARRMRGVESELHTARALQVDALGS